MNTYTIVLERISTGETAPSLVTRQASEQAARAYAEAAIAQQADAADLRVAEIQARGEAATTRKASAAKRGRNPRWPYVPIVEHSTSRGDGKWPLVRRQQLRAVAFATRAEAVAHAQKTIDLWARP